jgi:hypothetical protein
VEGVKVEKEEVVVHMPQDQEEIVYVLIVAIKNLIKSECPV